MTPRQQRIHLATLLLGSLLLMLLGVRLFGADTKIVTPRLSLPKFTPSELHIENTLPVFDPTRYGTTEIVATPVLQSFSLLNYYPGWYFSATNWNSNTFAFPYRGGSFPAFVVRTNATPQNISGGAITATFRVVATPDAIFRFGGQDTWNTGHTPPHVRLFVSSYLGYLAENAHPEWSWWSADGWQVISNGTFTITASFDPSRWTDSHGQQLPGTFAAVLTNVIECGVSFGGGNFYDIGVGMTAGNATFEMLALDFLPGTGALSLNLTDGLNAVETSTDLINWYGITYRTGPTVMRLQVADEPYRFWRATQ